MKYMIRVDTWPFMTIKNRLQLTMQAEASGVEGINHCIYSESSVDSNNNVQWFKLNIQGVSLYLY